MCIQRAAAIGAGISQRPCTAAAGNTPAVAPGNPRRAGWMPRAAATRLRRDNEGAIIVDLRLRAVLKKPPAALGRAEAAQCPRCWECRPR
jgi:hypothetical protein